MYHWIRENHVNFDVEKAEVKEHNIEKTSLWETRNVLIRTIEKQEIE